MITSGDQNQFPSSFAPLGDLLKTLIFLPNLNGFNSSPSLPDQGFAKWKGSSKVWKEKGSKWFCHLFSLSLLCFCFALLVCFALFFESIKFYALLCFCLTCFCLIIFQFCFILFYIEKKFKNKKNSKTVCVCVHWYLCTLDGHWNKVF